MERSRGEKNKLSAQRQKTEERRGERINLYQLAFSLSFHLGPQPVG
jgi:hypothetical protein